MTKDYGGIFQLAKYNYTALNMLGESVCLRTNPLLTTVGIAALRISDPNHLRDGFHDRHAT